jgi:hypothetical protein
MRFLCILSKAAIFMGALAAYVFSTISASGAQTIEMAAIPCLAMAASWLVAFLALFSLWQNLDTASRTAMKS